MEIIYKSPSELKPFQKNPYNHPEKQLTMLKKSMREFGFTSPILVSQDNMVIAGHARLKAAQEIGLSEVPTIFIDLPYEKAVAYIIADNQLAKLAEEDRDLLGELLEGALSIPDFDIEAVGFSSEDIDTLLKSGDPVEVVEDEFNSDGDIETRCKEGDLWQLGRHFLLCGDSSLKDDVTKLMNGNEADLFLTDPPYGVSYADKNRFLNVISPANRIQEPIENDHGSVDDMSILWKAVFTNAFDVCRPGACYYIYSPQGGELMMMMMMMIRDSGWLLKHSLIWVKNNHVLGRSDYNYKHEPILYGWKEGAGHSYYGGASKTSVWEFDKPHQSDLHPTMKPIPLFAECINNATKPEDIILDLFAGSGTTIMAAEQLNRIAYCIEKSEHYCDVILSRWEQFTNQTAKKLN